LAHGVNLVSENQLIEPAAVVNWYATRSARMLVKSSMSSVAGDASGQVPIGCAMFPGSSAVICSSGAITVVRNTSTASDSLS